MAWKAPGEGGKDKGSRPKPANPEGRSGPQDDAEKDPWREGRARPSPDRPRPPDLDEVIKSLWRSLTGRRRRKNSGTGGSGGAPRKNNALMLPGIIAGTAALVWIGAGVYTIDEGNVGVVMRQGHYHGTVPAGIHWNPSLIDRVTRIEVGQDRWLTVHRQQLTHDGSLATLHVRASYRIVSAQDYLLRVQRPEQLLQGALEAAVSHVMMSRSLGELTGGDRAVLSSAVAYQLQQAFSSEAVGVELHEVRVDSVSVPNDVQAAMAEAQQSRQQAADAVRVAENTRARVIAEAERNAHHVQEEARAYRDTAVSYARSDIAQFMAVLRAYERAPDVTRDRLYLDTVHKVMATPGTRVVSAQNGDVQISLAPVAPVPPPASPEATRHAGDNVPSAGSSIAAPDKSRSTASRSDVRSDRDISDRRYDRSLTEGRQ